MPRKEIIKHIFELAKSCENADDFERLISINEMPENCPKCGNIKINTWIIGFVHECPDNECKHIF